jgi:hypothetical protein
LSIVCGGSRIKSHPLSGFAEIIEGKVVLVVGAHHENGEITPLIASVELSCARLRITPHRQAPFSAAKNAVAELELG